MKKIVSLFLAICISFVFISINLNEHGNIINLEPLLIDEYSHLSASSQKISDNEIITDDYVVTVEHTSIYDENDFEEDSMFADTHQHFHDTSNDNPDDYIVSLREKQKDFYINENEEFINSLNNNLNEAEISYSHFAPFIQITFDDYEDYLDSDLDVNELLTANNVKTVYVNNGTEYVSNLVTRPSWWDFSNAYDYETALNDVGINSNKYEGSGIKIGVIEIGMINNYFGLTSSNVVIDPNHSTYYSDDAQKHAEVVSNIIAGSYGISENSKLYISSIGSNANQATFLYDSLNWQIGYPQSVNVINMSLGSSNGTYTSRSKLLDFLTINTKTLFVVSSGNGGGNNSSNHISNGMNVVSVGSINKEGNLSFFSDAGQSSALSGVIRKPTIVAPGERLHNLGTISNRYLENPSNYVHDDTNDGHTGTSFSAPIVTGICALLMEEYSYLKLEPWTIHSILVSSAVPINGQTTIYDNLSGFGLVNYDNARNICYNNNFVTITKSIYSSANSETFYGGYLTVPAGRTVTLKSVIFMPQSSVPNLSTGSATPVYSNYTISLVQSTSSSNLVVASKNANYYYLTYTNTTSNSQNLYIKVKLNGSFNSSSTEYGSITFTGEGIHHHWYRHYVSANRLTHTLACNCGETYAFSHYVSDNGWIDPIGGGGINRDRYCGECGYILDPKLPWPVLF